MATLTYISTSNRNGAKVVEALEQIRTGLGTLRELDGLRAESIGAGQATMATNFGIQDNAQAQIVSDRWSALMDALINSGNSAYDEYALLRDFVNATTWAP